MSGTPQSVDALASLRQFIRPRRKIDQPCELCGAELPAEHEHLVRLADRHLACTCQACAILFSDGNAHFRRVPRRAERLTDFQLSDAQWDGLLIPIELAFFFENSTAGRPLAMYPSPAGPTESLLELTSWRELVEQNPVLGRMRPDVEALLVNRVGGAREYYRVSIDRCYELVGLIRLHWRGLSGGTEVWRHIGSFFDRLRQAEGSTAHG